MNTAIPAQIGGGVITTQHGVPCIGDGVIAIRPTDLPAVNGGRCVVSDFNGGSKTCAPRIADGVSTRRLGGIANGRHQPEAKEGGEAMFIETIFTHRDSPEKVK